MQGGVQKYRKKGTENHYLLPWCTFYIRIVRRYVRIIIVEAIFQSPTVNKQ